MDLRHYSEYSITLDYSRTYTQKLFMKPFGLWISIGAAWRKWCEDENWGLDGIIVEHKITLNQNANILHLRNFGQIIDFAQTFSKNKAVLGFKNFNSMFIDWPQIALLYDGIIISPYCWTARNDPHTAFYYGWDCASGCIWNLNAIKSLEGPTP